jgi:hypothetical protein
MWYALPDVIASVILTGRIPKIIRAIRLKARGQQRELKSIKLRDQVSVDPRKDDFFKRTIEERQRVKRHKDLPEVDRCRLDKSLKVLTNATSYGILAEMTRHELPRGQSEEVTVFGAEDAAFTCSVTAPEEPGEYCFPPIAALITAAARLQLALLEHCITDLGGTYAMEDTDSMAIVATEHGGLVPCPGGPDRTRTGSAAVRALSWAKVRGIVERFAVLNPYDRTPVPGSILKIEDDNFDPSTGAQREIYCYAISAKRYALLQFTECGEPELLKRGTNAVDDHWSEHGLGHLLNPIDLKSDDRNWIATVWLGMIRAAMGLKVSPTQWFNRPAVTRVSISSPAVWRLFTSVNAGKPYMKQVKPFNFVLSAHLAPDGHPSGVTPERFHLIAPYESDARKWTRMPWIDRYTGESWNVTTTGTRGTRNAARLTTYGDVIVAYALHPESKSAGADGVTCDKQHRGLLQRRQVSVASLTHIGKESNKLEEVQSGSVHDLREAYTEYIRSSEEQQQREWLAVINSLTNRELQDRTGLARSTIQRIRNNGVKPRNKTAASLTSRAGARVNHTP